MGAWTRVLIAQYPERCAGALDGGRMVIVAPFCAASVLSEAEAGAAAAAAAEAVAALLRINAKSRAK
jgi:hypothetical protein